MTRKQEIVPVQLQDEKRSAHSQYKKQHPQKLVARLKGVDSELFIYEGIQEECFGFSFRSCLLMKIIDFTKVENIFIVCGKTDMRRQIDGLAATVIQEYDMNVYDDALFLFCGGKKDRFKALYWEGDGFILIYKRLENGRLKWPKNQQEVQQLTSQQLRWLLEGLSIDQKVTIKPADQGYIG